ncbi:MAG: DUF1232 domain-containing protein [Spirochaetes bacterium]|nr:DUF1232 domain-containing protein [Spirochaetota bacterium]
MKKRKRLRSLLKNIYHNIWFEITTAHLCLMHPRTPKKVKIILAIALAYTASPIDLIPDFIPVIGHLDDAVIIPLMILIAWKLTPGDVISECRQKAAETVYSPGKNIFAAAFILLFYASVITVIIFLFCSRFFKI